jgi:hypothetical protein
MMKTLKSILLLLASFVSLQMMAITYQGAYSIVVDGDHFRYLGSQLSVDGNNYGYFSVDPNGRTLTGLVVEMYDSAAYTTSIEEVDLTSKIVEGQHVYDFPLAEGANVVRMRAQYGIGDEKSTEYSYYYDGLQPYVYAGDISYTLTTGYNSTVYVDHAQDGAILNLGGNVYNKGFGFHAAGSAQFDITPGKYSRFVSDAGKQYGQIYCIDLKLYIDGTEVDSYTHIDQSVVAHWDYDLTDTNSSIKVWAGTSNDNNWNDHVSLGGTRFYLPTSTRQPQTLTWGDETEFEVNAHKDMSFILDASASSGLPVMFRIIKGADAVKIIDDGQLVFPAAKEATDVVIEAYQPGDEQWDLAPAVVHTYHVSNTVVVQIGETITLESEETVDDLIDFNDGFNNTGQVQTTGLAQVGQLDYQYRFRSDVWNFIAFPTDVNLDQISNLNELGFKFGGEGVTVGTPGYYYIKKYNSEALATGDGSEEWTLLTSEPKMDGKCGYLMMVSNVGGEPVEVSFTLDNVWLPMTMDLEDFNVSFDFSACDPNTTQTVYVRSKNVDGNTLKLTVDYEPEEQSTLPVNHARALKEARVTYTPNRAGLRLTLPDASLAKVVIYDAKGKNLIKAVNYHSPQMIDVSDLAPGNYNMYISYGNAVAARQFRIPKR